MKKIKKIKHKFNVILIFILCFCGFNAVYAQVNTQPNPQTGEKLAAACAACHGPDGNSSLPANPNLAGQNEKYFVAQMQAFVMGQKGPRFNPVMQALATGLSKEQINDIAAFYAEQKIKVGTALAKYVKRGERIYRGGLFGQGIPACSACHGPKGLGNAESGFPALSGQHAEYVVAQLEAYKNGSRKGDLNEMMQLIAKKLTREDMDAVASYIAGLH